MAVVAYRPGYPALTTQRWERLSMVSPPVCTAHATVHLLTLDLAESLVGESVRDTKEEEDELASDKETNGKKKKRTQTEEEGMEALREDGNNNRNNKG